MTLDYELDYKIKEDHYRGFPRLDFKYACGGFINSLVCEFISLMEMDNCNGGTLDWGNFHEWILKKFDGELLDVYNIWIDNVTTNKLTLIFNSEEDKTLFILKYI